MTPVWEIRIIHPALSAARKTCGTAGERKMHLSSASTYPCLPQGRQEPRTDLGSLVPQDIAQVPALLKAVAFALERPGTGHMGFSVRKIGVFSATGKQRSQPPHTT